VALSSLQRQPVLINVGRGDVVDDASLLAALDQGHISAAILDVFAKVH
jgi:phosphoglycerate dehydrogenase-like enzyme